jgi:hypothetical protein
MGHTQRGGGGDQVTAVGAVVTPGEGRRQRATVDGRREEEDEQWP